MIQMKINLNEIVTYKLTPKAQEFRKNDDYARVMIRDLGDGRFESEIWTIMNVFGPEMYMGNTDCTFEGMTIETRGE
mgnify:CR=1 FL=1